MSKPRLVAAAIAAALTFLIALSVMAQPAGPSVAAPLGGAASELSLAMERFKRFDFEGALASLKSACAADADLPPAEVLMAQWFAQAGELGRMRAALEDAVAGEPNDPEAYVLLSDIALRENRLAESELLSYRAYNLLENFQRSARRKTLLIPRVLGNLAAVCEAREDWPAAQKYLNAWLSVEPESVVATQRLGQALFHLGRPDEAAERFRAAAKLDQKLLSADVIMARLYRQAGQEQKAAQTMAAAIRSDPADAKTRLAAAQLAVEAGDYAEAAKQADAAAELNPDSLEVKHCHGLVALFRRELPKAEQIFESAVKQSPTNFAATNNLAVALAEQDDQAKRQRALAYAQANVRQYPRQAEAYATQGWVLFRLGRTDEAERSLRMASTGAIVAPDTNYFLARIAADEGRAAEARQLLQTALSSKSAFLLRKEAEELAAKLK